MNLISQDSSYDDLAVSDTDLIKGIVDLLFTYTTNSSLRKFFSLTSSENFCITSLSDYIFA